MLSEKKMRMAKKRILELGAEGTEIALKQVLDDSVLKEIPIVGSIVKLYDIGTSIRDRLFTEKVRQFLIAIRASLFILVRYILQKNNNLAFIKRPEIRILQQFSSFIPCCHEKHQSSRPFRRIFPA